MTISKLAIARAKSGYVSQASFAKALDVDRTTAWAWEKGDRVPRAIHMVKLSELLGLSIAEVAGLFE